MNKQVYSECFYGGASLDLQTEDYLQLFDCEYLYTVDEYNVYKNTETGNVFVIEVR